MSDIQLDPYNKEQPFSRKSDNPCNACWREAKRESDRGLECQNEYHRYLFMREMRQMGEQSREEWVSVMRDSVDDDLEGAPF